MLDTMTGQQKKKLCWNCDGRVSLEESNCPFCGVYLGPSPDKQSAHDILPSPYKIVDSDESDNEGALYGEGGAQEEEVFDDVETSTDFKEVVLPLVLLSTASLFFLFGLALFLFSVDGTLTLSWNGTYWYAYVLVAFPLALFGWIFLQKPDHSN